MQNEQIPEKTNGFQTWINTSITLKILVIGVLILLLLVPSSMISRLIEERQDLRDEAIKEVSSKWGDEQLVGSPVVSIPYNALITDKDGKQYTETRYAHFLPDKLVVDGVVTPEKRQRGIYVVVLYNSVLNLKLNFDALNFTDLGISKESLMLNKAFLSLGITDMKGIKQNPKASVNGIDVAFNPGIASSDIYTSGVSLPIDLSLAGNQKLAINIGLDLNGSSRLYFLPFGKQTDVKLVSKWADPSFEGSFLPDERKVSPQGFEAAWKVLQFNRNYAQQGLGSYLGEIRMPSNNANNYAYTETSEGNENNKIDASVSAFGVKLMLPIDEYQKTLRSTKYNVMFIVITFLTFFFIEILNRKRLHPIQYLLIGAAICLFYILLLSLSEHIVFDSAYWLSGFLVISLIAGYSWFVLKNLKLTALVAGVLLVLYGFFYALLQLQDYALLMGSVGLLLILATIMYLTRNIDWYNLNKQNEQK